jgi:threonylcarbamoyladenosine tRNA methylthiotransferase MtaB
MKTVAFHTLGCKVNQVETEQIKDELISNGYQVIDFSQPADLYIINTCTVTHVSDRKSRAVIRRALKANPEATVVVTGCMAELEPEKIASMKGVNLIVGNRDKHRIAQIIDSQSQEPKDTLIIREPICSQESLAPVFYSDRHERTRAFVKIQDGCQSFCTYCIVPYTRGPVRSKKPDDVVQEIKQLVNLGYREVVLTGIHTGQYGRSMPGWSLDQLLEKILESVPGHYRIRLSSIELGEISDRLIQLMKNDTRLCRHLHIPLQSGSDAVLKRMARRYNRDEYRSKVLEIAELVPGIGFAADVMVGFPGETDADFDQTVDLIQNLPLLDLHVFKYSPRPGTPAASFPDQVDERLKSKRSNGLISIARQKHTEFIERQIGQSLTVLVEECQSGRCNGFSDNYIDIEFSSPHDLCGQFVDVVLEGIYRNRAVARF